MCEHLALAVHIHSSCKCWSRGYVGSRHGNPVDVREGVHGSVATFVVHSIARAETPLTMVPPGSWASKRLLAHYLHLGARTFASASFAHEDCRRSSKRGAVRLRYLLHLWNFVPDRCACLCTVRLWHAIGQFRRTTDCMEQSHSWGAHSSRTNNKKSTLILLKSKVNYRVLKSPPLVPVVSQMNPVSSILRH